MKPDILNQFSALRERLLQEQKEINTRLADIERQLNQPRGRGGTVRRKGAPPSFQARESQKKSLRSLVNEATQAGPLSCKEIAAAVQKKGYLFTTNDPVAAISALVKNSPELKEYGRGKFGPADS